LDDLAFNFTLVFIDSPSTVLDLGGVNDPTESESSDSGGRDLLAGSSTLQIQFKLKTFI
jgi:hypothetical protein